MSLDPLEMCLWGREKILLKNFPPINAICYSISLILINLEYFWLNFYFTFYYFNHFLIVLKQKKS